jgi:Domain of unknown function (DUF4388)
MAFKPEQVVRKGFKMHANQGRLLRVQISKHEGQMSSAIQQALKFMHPKLAPSSSPRFDFQKFDQRFFAQPMLHQIRHRDHQKPMTLTEGNEIRHASHAAIFFHDFADHATGMEPCEPSEIHAGLGLSGARQHATGAGPQGEHMAGFDEIIGLARGVDERLDRSGTVEGADARGGSRPRFHGHAKSRFKGAGVVPHHHRNLQTVQQLTFKCGADQASAMGGHEIDGLGRDMLGRHGEIAFVFPVFIIDDHDHVPQADGLDGLVDARKGGFGARVHAFSFARKGSPGKGLEKKRSCYDLLFKQSSGPKRKGFMSQGGIQGSMRETPLADIIQLVCGGGKSGVFHVQMDSYRAKIFLKDGKIVHAISNSNEGFEALMDVALWLDGTYRFEEGPQDVQASITKPNASILMELGRRMDEWRVISQKIASPDLYPHTTLLPGDAPAGVNPRQSKLLAITSGWYTVSEIAEVMQKPVLTIAKDLYDLVMAGHVHMKGVRSGRPPKLDGIAPAASVASMSAPAPISVSAPPAPPRVEPAVPSMAAPMIEETVIVKLMPPPPVPLPVPASSTQGFPLADEPVMETVGGGIAQTAAPVVSAPSSGPVPAARPVPSSTPVSDPVRMAKLTAFTQRIAVAAKAALPEAHHEMVNRLQAQATQAIIGGEGPDAVKNLALGISRGAVDAGCDAELVRTLNAQLKALFSAK